MELSAPTTPILLKAPLIQGIVTGHRRSLKDLVRAIDQTGLKPAIDSQFNSKLCKKHSVICKPEPSAR